MEKGLLIILPRYDDVTEYLSAFSNPILNFCSEQGIKIKKLEKEQTNRQSFEKALRLLNYNFIVLNGHGAINVITGHKGEIILKSGDNDTILCNRITYARSCWAASELGESSMKANSTGCFIGYEIPFMFLIDITYSTNPIKDHIAEVFFETTNLIPLGLLKGQTAKIAEDNSKKSMLKAIKKTLIKGDNDSQTIAETLWNNYFGQVLLGNPEARI